MAGVLLKSQQLRAKGVLWSVELVKVHRAQRLLRVSAKSVEWQRVHYQAELDRNTLLESGFPGHEEFDDWFAFICESLASPSSEWAFQISGGVLTATIIGQRRGDSQSYQMNLNREPLSQESYVSLLRDDCAAKDRRIEQLQTEKETLLRQLSNLKGQRKKQKRDLSQSEETDQTTAPMLGEFHTNGAERAKLRRQSEEASKQESKRRKKGARVAAKKKKVSIKVEKWLETDEDRFGRLLKEEDSRPKPFAFELDTYALKRCPYTGCLKHCKIMGRQTRVYVLDGREVAMNYYLCTSQHTKSETPDKWQFIHEDHLLDAEPTTVENGKVIANRKAAAHWLICRLMREFFDLFDTDNQHMMSKSVMRHYNRTSKKFWDEFHEALAQENGDDSQSVVKIRLPMYFQKYDDPDYKCLAKSVRVRSDIAPTASEIFQVLKAKLMSRVANRDESAQCEQIEAFHIDWFNKLGGNAAMVSRLKSDTERCLMFGFEYSKSGEESSSETIDVTLATTWDNVTDLPYSTCFFGFRRMISQCIDSDLDPAQMFARVYEIIVRVMRAQSNERVMSALSTVRCLEYGSETAERPLLDLRFQYLYDSKRNSMLKHSPIEQAKCDVDVSQWNVLDSRNVNEVVSVDHLLVVLFDQPMYQLYCAHI